MTNANFSRPDAIDLSNLAAAADKPATAGASYRVELTSANFEAVLSKSTQHPIVLEITSPRAHGAAELDQVLTELANQAAGKYLLAVLDVDANPDIAQALQIQAVPLVAGVLAGQLAPLFQGTKDRTEVSAAIDALLQAAAANGILGKAEPVSAPASESEEPTQDPRFAAVDAALQSGDWQAAETAVDEVLKSNPSDADALATKAQIALMRRTEGLEAAAVIAAAAQDPLNFELAGPAADMEVLSGNLDAGFARLIAIVAASADSREPARERLLELFRTQPANSESVIKARKALTSALF